MKRRWTFFLGAVVLGVLLAGCSGEEPVPSKDSSPSASVSSTLSSSLESGQEEAGSSQSREESLPAESSRASEQPAESGQPAVSGTRLEIQVGDHVFFGELAQTQAANDLAEMFPMTLGMTDWQSAAKSFALPSALPQEPEAFSALEPGQLVLGDNGELLLFYEEYPQGGEYTPLAAVEDPDGLAEALEGPTVEVAFQMGEG